MTQHEKIIRAMITRRAQDWFFPPDFMGRGDGALFVGYEGSARFSELAKLYPEMIENRRRGKYLERRIRYEAVGEWWDKVPVEFQIAFTEAGVGPATITEI